MPNTELIPVERIQTRILLVRGQRVLLDADLAHLYGVPTKRLNEQVKRNARRFPEDFVFRLVRAEAKAVWRSRSQNATLKRGQNVKYLPYAFTEYGALQAANVLNSDTEVRMYYARPDPTGDLPEHDGRWQLDYHTWIFCI